MAYNNQQGYQQGQTDDIALGWDDVLDGDDANGYEPLPEGDYYFTVKNFVRGRYEGGEKLPPCNKAVLTLALQSAWTPTQEKPAASGEVTVNLFIVKSQRWKLSQFFIAIGYLKPGEEKAMNASGPATTARSTRAIMWHVSMIRRSLLCRLRRLLLPPLPPPHSMPLRRPRPTSPQTPLPGIRASNSRCRSPSNPPTPGPLVNSDGTAALSERGPDRCRR